MNETTENPTTPTGTPDLKARFRAYQAQAKAEFADAKAKAKAEVTTFAAKLRAGGAEAYAKLRDRLDLARKHELAGLSARLEQVAAKLSAFEAKASGRQQ
jgi:hypothetical protein